MNYRYLLSILLLSNVFIIYAQLPITPSSAARIAISSDGNHHDEDDIAATPMSLMILAKAGLQDNLVLYTYADHIWGNHPTRGDRSLGNMREGINGAKNRWNFDQTEFIEAVTTPEKAYNAMRDAINESSAASPLYIICAGPMQVVGTGLQRARQEKRKFVTLISHSGWNDNHANEPANNGNDIEHRDWLNNSANFAWTWRRMMNRFGGVNGVTFSRILNQNSSTDPDNGFSTKSVNNVDQRGINRAERDRRRALNFEYWHWMRDHQDPNIQWVYSRMEASKRADASDAGMAWYVAKNDENGSRPKLKAFIDSGINIGTPPGSGNTGITTNINGLIVFEAENTPSDLDLWILKNDVPNYTGTGHIEFTGNAQGSGPATSPLEYTFTVTQAGIYQLIIKSRKRLAGAPPDKSNDSFIRLEGDFDESPDAGDNHLDDAPKRILARNSKLFGGKANSWGWSERIDLGHNNKRFPVYRLKAGETYTMVISGRSKNYNIDKIVFFNTSQYTLQQARNVGFDAEETIEGGAGGPSLSIETPAISDRTSKKELTCFPNPTLNSVTLTQSLGWELYTLTGKFLVKGEGNFINLISYPKGIYFVTTETNKMIKVIKN